MIYKLFIILRAELLILYFEYGREQRPKRTKRNKQ